MNVLIAQAMTLTVALSTHAQTFTNLNFEQAHPNPDTPGLVTAASAFPDWTVSIDGIQQTQVYYNVTSTGATQVALVSASSLDFTALDGNYSALLEGLVPGSVASISQTGLIPAGTQSLFFEANGDADSFELFVGTIAVPFAAIGAGPNYFIYGANISTWADDTEQITFSDFGGSPNIWEIDDISFSPTSIAPEPSIIALTAIGGMLFGARKSFARRF